MKELNIEEMTSLRGGASLADVSHSFNNSNNFIPVAVGNTAAALTINSERNANNANGDYSVAGQRDILQSTTANAGNVIGNVSQG